MFTLQNENRTENNNYYINFNRVKYIFLKIGKKMAKKKSNDYYDDQGLLR